MHCPLNITHVSRKVIRILIVSLFLLYDGTPSFSQNASNTGNIFPAIKGHHWRKTAFSPKVLLVQLRSEQSRIEHLLREKKTREANKVIKEASIVRKVIKNDFEENFSFCPVYYFMDTNVELIKKQIFDNVVFTADGIPMKETALYPGDTDYFIVYYGYPEEQMTLNTNPDEYNSYNNGTVMGKGLIFLNYKYQQVDFYYRFEYMDIFDHPDPRYSYKSDTYDIEYYPFAAKYQEDLDKKINGIFINKKLPRRY